MSRENWHGVNRMQCVAEADPEQNDGGVTAVDSHARTREAIEASWEHMAESYLELHVVQDKKIISIGGISPPW